MDKGYIIRLCSKYLKVVRGKGLAKGESPISLSVKHLHETHKMQCIQVAEKSFDYLEKNKNVMREVIAANKTLKKPKKPKKPKVAKREFLETYAWRKVRMEALLKYGPRCMCCGATPQTGAVMNVDHIKPRKTHPELALSVENLQILCGECNHGKGNWNTTDWREKWKV
jgi:5-methylcytosine-specific restriction endonuclease McrA